MGTQTKPRKFGIVTGGTSGIGLELAKQFLANGFDVLVVGDTRVEEARLELEAAATAAGVAAEVHALECDLATGEGVDQLIAEIGRIGRPIGALAINAGVGVWGRFVETPLDEELRMIALNCDAVVRIAKALVPAMIEQREGRILITASVAATMPAPYLAVYGATKAFDLSFAEALRYELKDTGITVTALQPSATDTDFFARADMEDTKVGQAEKDDPALVAKQGFEAMMKGDDKVYAGSLKSRAQGLASELLPETTKAKLHAKQAEPRPGRKS